MNNVLSDFKLQFKIYGTSSILIEWPKIISEDVLKNMLNFKEFIENNYVKQKIHIISSYNSLLVVYDKGIDNVYNEISHIESWYLSFEDKNFNTTKLWKIPVTDDKVTEWQDLISQTSVCDTAQEQHSCPTE